MGNGYNSGPFSTEELFCGPKTGGGPSPSESGSATGDGGGTQIRPNVAAGNTGFRSANTRRANLFDRTNDHLDNGSNDIDTEDFSMEFWIRRLFPDSITNWQSSGSAATGYCVTGIADGVNAGDGSADDFVAGTSGADRQDAAGIQVRGANFEAFYQEIGTTFVSRSFTLGFGYHHVAINYDRSGNMETFVDGTSFGTNAINNNRMEDFTAISQFCNITGQAAASGKAEVPYLLAGWALHVGLLTNAQILASVRNISLQTLGANTFHAFFYDDITLLESAITVSSVVQTTRAIYTTTTRSELATIIADLRLPVVEITAANQDVDHGGVAGAIQVRTTDTNTGEYAFIKNLNAVGGHSPPASGSNQHLAILGGGNFEDDESDTVHFSPALVADPTWPPTRGTSGTDYA